MAVVLTEKNKIIIDQNLYKWHKHWGRLQKKFFSDEHELYEKHKIDNFIKDKKFNKIYHIKDNHLDFEFTTTQNIDEADLILITDQKFSRYRCEKIISEIKNFLDRCPNLFVCLNRHYLNITGTETDETLPDDYQQAIEVWLQKNIPYTVENYSERFIDDGSYFTWVIPDQKFYITKK